MYLLVVIKYLFARIIKFREQLENSDRGQPESAANVEIPMGNTESVVSCTECKNNVTYKGRISPNAEVRCNK